MENYLPYYPDVDVESFYQDLMQKFEFTESKEDLSSSSNEEGIFFHYQTNIARFLSSKTMYDSLLLIHEMGTGKSGSAIATAHLVRKQDSSFRKTIILANGKTQLNNFKSEIMNRLPHLYDKYKDTKEPRVILRREGFLFETYRIFSKTLQNKSEEDIRRLYDHSILIFDEIHNITTSLKSGTIPSASDKVLTNIQTYEIIYKFVHTLQHRKLLCLTGTPIRDKPQEIAKVLNLVIPTTKKFPIGEEFKNTFLKPVNTISVLGDATLTTYEIKQDMIPQFVDNIRGYVSYLKKSVPRNITITYRTNPDFENTGLEHFKVYANVMKEPQSSIYIDDFVEDLQNVVKSDETEGMEEDEEDTEEMIRSTEKTSSLAYSKSKQSSIMVFPNREMATNFISPIFEKTTVKGVVKTGRFLKSIGWTKRMRLLFPKELSLQDKLDRLYGYSCIYATIIKQILFNPSELVYIYSFLKSGSGVYTLASFLVEYFGFEIVRKLSDVRTKATQKRRLLILNHDFMSDTELREMVDFFNQNDNATAEYIQVVIGTKQTKEGITLKNIRQIHVVQPEWNYADISQAIHRGIRVNSHNALLREMDSISVNIFQHVAVPMVEDEPSIEYSIDIDQYRRSEIKDMNIKMIERQLITSSWDCYLNQERNTGTEDFSRECEYQKCKYKCRGIAPDFVPKYDYSTYNMYYSDISQTLLQQRIRTLFQKSQIMTFDELKKELQNTSSLNEQKNRVLLSQVLEEMIMNATYIPNNRLDTTYLRKSRVFGLEGSKTFVDSYFLVPDVDQYNLYDNLYTRQPIFMLPTSFEDVTRKLYYKKFPQIMTVVSRLFYADEKNRDRCRTILLQSPVHLQEQYLEFAIIQQLTRNVPVPFFTFIIEHYENQARLEKSGNIYISSLLSDRKRQLDTTIQPFTWVDVPITEVEETFSEESNEFIKKFITENPFKYYGIIEISKDKTIFKIRDVRNQELVFGSNKAKIPKGEVCAASFSRKKSGLVDILLALQWKPSEDDMKTLPPIDKIRQVLSMKDKDRLWKDLESSVENTDDDILKVIYILNSKKIPELCLIVRQRFKDLDLLHEKRI